MRLWLSPEFFDWNRDPLNPTISKDSDFLKPYQLLKHAKKRLDEVNDKENPDKENLALGDSVYHLRGAIEHREKQLKEKFNLAGLSVWESSERKAIPVYEKLYRLGIIQPILHKKLIDLRNFITHEQKFPYNKNKSEISDLYGNHPVKSYQ